MSIIVKLPSRDVANYLIAVNACAVYLTDAWRIGATTAAGLHRLPHSTNIVWLAWTQRMHEVEQIIAREDLLWRPGAGGVRVLRPQLEIIERIEARAHELNIALTPHARACERALRMTERLDAIMRDLRQSGALQAFNRSYRIHRLKMNGHAPLPGRVQRISSRGNSLFDQHAERANDAGGAACAAAAKVFLVSIFRQLRAREIWPASGAFARHRHRIAVVDLDVGKLVARGDGSKATVARAATGVFQSP
jgi:hypothetical protein